MIRKSSATVHISDLIEPRIDETIVRSSRISRRIRTTRAILTSLKIRRTRIKEKLKPMLAFATMRDPISSTSCSPTSEQSNQFHSQPGPTKNCVPNATTRIAISSVKSTQNTASITLNACGVTSETLRAVMSVWNPIVHALSKTRTPDAASNWVVCTTPRMTSAKVVEGASDLCFNNKPAAVTGSASSLCIASPVGMSPDSWSACVASVFTSEASSSGRLQWQDRAAAFAAGLPPLSW
mmetsp:Transcript_112259/g.317305  ORF Transcript_112259/g.317305 Transcript_112259/m.317305 type:complete len:238 (-) Transcript_112259:27-740(-)